MRNLYANVSTSFSFLFPSWNYDSTKEIELIKEKIIANHPDVKFSESIRRTFSYDPEKEKEEMLIHTLNISFSVSEEISASSRVIQYHKEIVIRENTEKELVSYYEGKNCYRTGTKFSFNVA